MLHPPPGRAGSSRQRVDKVSRAMVDYAVERKAGTIASGAVRDVADGKRMTARSQQKSASGRMATRASTSPNKAQAKGMSVALVDEHNTSKACPHCGRPYKPRGRVSRCPKVLCVGWWRTAIWWAV